MHKLLLPFTPRFVTFTLAIIAALAIAFFMATTGATGVLWWLALLAAASLCALGIHDLLQERHAILRNYPIAAHLRFIFEAIRPEMRQYFFESEKDGAPFSRDRGALVYQRAKKELDKRPFGTQHDVYADGYEWVRHSMAPSAVQDADFRVAVGGPDCAKPYSASVFNISAMSFGSLSANAIRALNKGAAMGGFAHDTGEGGYSPHHAEFGGDIIWEIGSGYFGARNLAGKFAPERFAETAANPQIKMIELKLSQGAKPGHGGVLPGAKVSAEIAAIRGVKAGVDCVSPARHSTFATPIELMLFIAELRRLSGGKPVGFKLCVGHPWEFLAICKAMLGDRRLS
jgi:glutamate synthase domain-containing protein 2